MKFSVLPRIYVDSNLILGQEILLPNQLLHYVLKVLRLNNGANLRVFNSRDGEFIAEIKIISKNNIILILNEYFRKIEPISQDITLALSMIKTSQYFEAIDMAVQLGITKILPLYTEYSQKYSLNLDKLAVRIIEATRQSERISCPVVLAPSKLAKLNFAEYSAILYPNEHEIPEKNILSISANCDFNNILIVVGPEGGFSGSDLKVLAAFSNAHSVSLGNSVLRSETAVIAVLSQIKLITHA